ncbi:hypothetical protein CKAH01_11727 [Colletotrichum kahawae]|uniref:Uncharacterized protein n=1 Tax=Colletotrichum kahawae TaxID=34407 RepID=A0AAD9YTZ3_COLKA|nr:hypothetical protein CKAH01_11727 [Colletotrichum kahawae]
MGLQALPASIWERSHELSNGVPGWAISHHHFPRLLAQLVVMILLNLKRVRHLTLQLSTHILQEITEFASQTILMPQQDGKKNKICQLSTLRYLAMGAISSDQLQLVAQIGPGFGALFSWDVGAEVFLQGFAVKNALANIAPKLGSIALNHCFISKSQLHQVLNRCQALEKFIFICGGAPAGYPLPSPGDTIDMLEKHTATLKTLCLDFRDFDYSRNYIPLYGLGEFTALERLSLSNNTIRWIIDNTFGCEGIYKEVKRDTALNATITYIPFLSTIPPSLKVFHIADLTQGDQTKGDQTQTYSIPQEKLATIFKRIENKPFFFQYSDLDCTGVMWSYRILRRMGVLVCRDSSQAPALW